jgi:hypothetical protein
MATLEPTNSSVDVNEQSADSNSLMSSPDSTSASPDNTRFLADDENTTPLLSDTSPLLLPGDRQMLNVLDDDLHYEINQRTPFMESPGIFFRERFEAGSIKGSVFTLVGRWSLTIAF